MYFRGWLYLIGTALIRADLRKAYLGNADLIGADLRGADLSGAEYNRDTLWPEGFNPDTAGAILIKEAS